MNYLEQQNQKNNSRQIHKNILNKRNNIEFDLQQNFSELSQNENEEDSLIMNNSCFDFSKLSDLKIIDEIILTKNNEDMISFSNKLCKLLK